jgi:hypothetical protein
MLLNRDGGPRRYGRSAKIAVHHAYFPLKFGCFWLFCADREKRGVGVI